jgi:hypothetical protein
MESFPRIESRQGAGKSRRTQIAVQVAGRWQSGRSVRQHRSGPGKAAVMTEDDLRGLDAFALISSRLRQARRHDHPAQGFYHPFSVPYGTEEAMADQFGGF